YTDRGPLVSQEAGSIDPMAVIDEKGERCLIWKEDGNSRKLPTIIWAQKLADDGVQLVGEKSELIHNDTPWEGAVVEGPFVLRRWLADHQRRQRAKLGRCVALWHDPTQGGIFLLRRLYRGPSGTRLAMASVQRTLDPARRRERRPVGARAERRARRRSGRRGG